MRVRSGTSAVPFYQWGTSTAWGWLNTSTGLESLRPWHLLGGLVSRYKRSGETAFSVTVQTFPGFTLTTSTNFKGAWVEGEAGTVTAKPTKVAKYIKLVLEIIGRGRASQRELQVVGGGFVYIAMFRRPSLSSLNQIWRTIVEGERYSPHAKVPLRRGEVLIQLIKFIGLCPLSCINLRCQHDEMVTASDASTLGGGICKRRGVTPYGLAASLSSVRGEIPEEGDLTSILSIGLFDGIGALRVALDALKAPVAGHISVEKSAEAHRVVEANFPESDGWDGVEIIDDEVVRG